MSESINAPNPEYARLLDEIIQVTRTHFAPIVANQILISLSAETPQTSQIEPSSLGFYSTKQ